MAIGGIQKEQREFTEYVLKVGVFEAKVIAINPDREEYEKKQLWIGLGRPLDEEKELEYLSESEDGNAKLRIDVYLEDVNEKVEDGEFKRRYKMAFFLENKQRENNELTKYQYINSAGTTSWADSENNLPDWFKEREFRIANSGEEALYTFLTSWLGELDLKKSVTTIDLDWKKLMKGNVKELNSQINGEWEASFLALASVRVKETPDGIKQYQSVHNKDFLPVYLMKNIRLVDYDDDKVLEKIEAKPKDKKKFYEKTILSIKGKYGCRDLHKIKPLMDFNPKDFIASGNEVIVEEDASY